MGLKEIIDDRISVIFYGSMGRMVGCSGKGIERATVIKSDLMHGRITVKPEASNSEVTTIKGRFFHEPTMPQLT